MMSFDIYDRDSKGRIEYEHMEEMVKVRVNDWRG